MKNNLSFYRHETTSHNHWKFKTLRRKYKWEGEGKFWALNNIIADAEMCALDLNDEVRKMAIAAELDFDVNEFEEYLNYLITNCRLVKEENGFYTTDIVTELFLSVDEKRGKERERKMSGRVQKSNVSAPVLPISARKDEKLERNFNKVNKSKEDNTESTGPHPLLGSNLFRKPKVPTLQQVREAFHRSGGSIEMADKFWAKYEATEWFLNGSPIRNFASLVPSFIHNFLRNNHVKPKQSVV